jgi:hypothetical protein
VNLTRVDGQIDAADDLDTIRGGDVDVVELKQRSSHREQCISMG